VQLDGHPHPRIFGTAAEGPGRLRIEAWRQAVIDLVTDLAAATDEAACVDYVLWHCGDVVLTELVHTLRHDARFVSLGGRWFVRRSVTRPPAAHLEALARTVLLTAEHPLTTEALLAQLSPSGAHDDGDLFGLAQAMIERPDLFANVAESSRPRWVPAGPPPGPFEVRYAAYDPVTRALLCEPGDALSPEVIERLWSLELLPLIVART